MKAQIIEQNDNTGCGIACVAMVSNKTYEEVKNTLKKIQSKRTRKGILTTQDDICLLLSEYNIAHFATSYTTIEDIETLSIIAVNKKKNGQYHWVVAFKKNDIFILDPEYGEVLRLKHNDYKLLKSGKAIDLLQVNIDGLLF